MVKLPEKQKLTTVKTNRHCPISRRHSLAERLTKSLFKSMSGRLIAAI
jgi:hypothetical protein